MAVQVSKFRYVALSFNISAVYIALGLLISLQPPFYPSEAEKKGATPAQYGFVFGIANLSLFIFSPIFGRYGSTIGPKLCFNVGAVSQGVSGFLFAFLPYIDSVDLFIGISYLLRFIEGMGTAMAWSSALGILMEIFPNKVGRVMSWTQTCFGLGYMLGPGVGAWFYEMGGFMLPFLVVGSLSTILSLLLVVTIPNVGGSGSDGSDISVEIEGLSDDEAETANLIGRRKDYSSDDSGASCSFDSEAATARKKSEKRGAGSNGDESDRILEARDETGADRSSNHAGTDGDADGEGSESSDQKPEVQLRFRTILKSPPLLLPFVDLFSALCGNGMLESMLEPHLRMVGASTIDVGITFLIFGCCYMVGNMFFGTAIDKLGRPTLFSLLGNFLFLMTFTFVGPLHFVPLHTSKSLVRGMMALAGVAYASLVVSSFSRAQKKVLEMGFEDGINTSTMISGIWLSAFSLGNFVGPTIAGALVQTSGFADTTLIFFGLYAFMIVVDLVDIVVEKINNRIKNRRSDYEEI